MRHKLRTYDFNLLSAGSQICSYRFTFILGPIKIAFFLEHVRGWSLLVFLFCFEEKNDRWNIHLKVLLLCSNSA